MVQEAEVGAAAADRAGVGGPLHEYVVASRLRKNRALHRALLLFRAALFILLLCYRVRSLRRRCDTGELESTSCRFNGELEVVALICEVWFCVNIVLCISCRWWLVERVTYPDRLLLQRMEELPAVDVFVTTADPTKEPPLLTMNTILSALAIGYPAQKLACYVSDDGGSLLTLWSLKETAMFAKHDWLPFCTKFSAHIHPRAPKQYFGHKSNLDRAIKYGFANEWHAMKGKYDALATKLSSMTKAYRTSQNETLVVLMKELIASSVSDQYQSTYTSWALNYDPSSHSSHCEIILERPSDNSTLDLPQLVYLSREKHPKQRHHFKAGAMNALLRVSGIMTNAPFVLNLDCDMYVNAPDCLLQAMCIFMHNLGGKEVMNDTGFVQFPQCFEGIDEDDIYGASMGAAMEIFIKGMDGVQGPPYCGTGCVHKRESLYGKSLRYKSSQMLSVGQKLGDMFGQSRNLILSAQEILSGTASVPSSLTKDALIVESNALMDCNYEENTSWGKEVGLMYGSVTEDLITGMKIHGRGWKSVTCMPYPPAFLGCAPTTCEDGLTTRKRWCMGALEILFSSSSPLLLNNLQGMSYMQRFIYIFIYGSMLSGFPLFVYSLLPAFSILEETPILPKVIHPEVLIPLSVAVFTYIVGIYENKVVGIGFKQWWNSERMEYIVAISSSILASYEILKKKLLGLRDTTFVITPKDQKTHNTIHNGHGLEGEINEQEEPQQGFEVNSTQPVFVLPTILVLFNMLAIIVSFFRIFRGPISLSLCPFTEVACSLWVLFVLFPFTKGFFLWLGRRSGPLALSSSTVLRALLIVTMLLLFIILI